MGHNVDFQDKSMSLTAPSLALSLVNVNPNAFSGLTFGVTTESPTNHPQVRHIEPYNRGGIKKFMSCCETAPTKERNAVAWTSLSRRKVIEAVASITARLSLIWVNQCYFSLSGVCQPEVWGRSTASHQCYHLSAFCTGQLFPSWCEKLNSCSVPVLWNWWPFSGKDTLSVCVILFLLLLFFNLLSFIILLTNIFYFLTGPLVIQRNTEQLDIKLFYSICQHQWQPRRQPGGSSGRDLQTSKSQTGKKNERFLSGPLYKCLVCDADTTVISIVYSQKMRYNVCFGIFRRMVSSFHFV